MNQYLLLVHDDMAKYSAMKKTDIENLIEQMSDWSEKLKKAGVHRGAEKLDDSPGKAVRYQSSKLTVTDGPYAESKELIGGFFIIEAPDYAAATEIAQECPVLYHGSSIEVRQIADSCSVVLDRAGA